MGNRKSNIANRSQHGSWHKRYLKDGVLPYGRKRKKKSPIVKQNKPAKKYVTKDFCNHAETPRLTKGTIKVQIEGLKSFISEAKKHAKNSINICFIP